MEATVAAVYPICTVERTPQDILSENKTKTDKEKNPSPEQKPVWAGLNLKATREKPAEPVIESAFTEAFHRDPRQENHWVSLVEGDNHQLQTLMGLGKKH